MTATETQSPGYITLPADLMHRLLDQLEGQTKAKRQQTKADYAELAVFGVAVLFGVVDGFMRALDRP
ncbi:hypothetical protein [Streptomyces sp. NRRL S-146]|uniref:hypothetical protein n=1 Tax=Streptomyces sp. NRRL S-146 TaxID=1463884 RepID=UPI0004CA78D9|nr:hypothetical protein [Streptomyces sp. NRRL S-146]